MLIKTSVGYYLKIVFLLLISIKVTNLCPVMLERDFKVIRDVQKYKLASKMYIVCNFQTDKSNLPQTTKMEQVFRKYANNHAERSLFLQILDLKTLNKLNEYFKHYFRLALFAVILDSLDDLNVFENAVQNITSFATWFLLFLGSSDPRLIEFCQHPSGNRFNLQMNSNVLVKCGDESLLSEWYSIRSNETTVIHLAKWNSNRTLAQTNFQPREERRSLEGKKLRIGIITDDMDKTVGDSLGRYEKFVNKLSRSMNFTQQFILDDKYGSYNSSTKTFNGMIGRVVNNEVDIAFGEFTLNENRIEAVDFAPSLFTTQYLYMKYPNESNIYWAPYTQEFSKRTWVVFLIFIILLPVPVLLIKVVIAEVHPFLHLAGLYFVVWRIFCQGPLPGYFRTVSLQITYYTITISCWLLHIHYMAFLTSYIASYKPNTPFTDVKGLVNDGSYKLILKADTEIYDYWTMSTNKDAVEVAKFLKEKKDLPLSTMDAINQLCNDRVVYIGTLDVMNTLLTNASCSILTIGSGDFKTKGLILAKNSPYTHFVIYYLHTYRAYGLLSPVRKLETSIGDESAKYSPVNIYIVTPLLIILTIGFCLSAIAILFECIYYKRRSKKKMMNILQSIRIETRLRHDGITGLRTMYLE